jgi:hypothetical protein
MGSSVIAVSHKPPERVDAKREDGIIPNYALYRIKLPSVHRFIVATAAGAILQMNYMIVHDASIVRFRLRPEDLSLEGVGTGGTAWGIGKPLRSVLAIHGT